MCNKHSFLLILILLLFFVRLSHQISCQDERNKNVDWFINYKIPKIDAEPSGSFLYDGKGYAYLTPTSSSWKLSTKSIMSGSMLENTMKDFYSNKQGLSYLFYNDDAPANHTGTAVGHLKGVVAFDGNTGFWLIHSIPKFADDNVFQYPDNAFVNGQSILCVTFRTRELNEICNQLLFSHPNIYAYGITDEVNEQLDNKAKTLFTNSPSFVRREPLTRTASLKSLGNKAFVSFAKDNQYKEDLYSDVIAPGIKSSLLTETWRRGSGTFLPPSCQSDYFVLDITAINMTITSRRNTKSIYFKSTEDHSKWAISEDNSRNWICVADMNRMESQGKRGGGALCFVSSPVRNAFRSIVAETDQCPTSRNSNNLE